MSGHPESESTRREPWFAGIAIFAEPAPPVQLIFTAIIVVGIIGRNFVAALRKVPDPRAKKVPDVTGVCKCFPRGNPALH